MNNKLVGVFGIAGMLMLVGCGEGSSSVEELMPTIPTVPTAVPTTVPTEGKDTLKITKQSDTVFTINWDKGYNGYSELLLDETADDRKGSRVMTDNANGEHILVCNFTSISADANTVSYLCEGNGPSVIGTGRVIRTGITMELDTPYYFSFNYGTDRVNQGPVSDLTYTAGKTLIVDEY